MLGLALGDALGAPFEGGLAERALWRCIGRSKDGKKRWTDDTQMSLDLAESLLACGELEQDDLARRFAASYRWSRGYGPGTTRILKKVRRGMPWREAAVAVYKDGSFGNGAGMRAPVIGLYFSGADSIVDLDRAARESSAVTHAHTLGQDGAVVIARAVAAALRPTDDHDGGDDFGPRLLKSVCADGLSPKFLERIRMAQSLFGQPTDDVALRARSLGNGMAALDSCVTAAFVAATMQNTPFLEVMHCAKRIGGDVDTIAAMAGAIYGAANGVQALPKTELAQLEARERIETLASELHANST